MLLLMIKTQLCCLMDQKYPVPDRWSPKSTWLLFAIEVNISVPTARSSYPTTISPWSVWLHQDRTFREIMLRSCPSSETEWTRLSLVWAHLTQRSHKYTGAWHWTWVSLGCTSSWSCQRTSSCSRVTGIGSRQSTWYYLVSTSSWSGQCARSYTRPSHAWKCCVPPRW